MKILILGSPTTKGFNAIGSKTVTCAGGWVENLICGLSDSSEFKIYFAFYTEEVDDITVAILDRVTYLALPCRVAGLTECNEAMKSDLKKIYDITSPDVTHIIGTEREHDYELFKIAGANETLVSITGLVHICARHYLAGIEATEYKRLSLGDILRRSGIEKQKKQYEKWGSTEKKLLSEAKFISGRTTWDYACVRQQNPDCEYFYCGEILNRCFSEGKWSPDIMNRHTIFVSSAGYPLKGFHMLLKAFPLILKRFPDSKIVVAGSDMVHSDSIIQKIKRTSYADYIKRLLKKYNFDELKVCFTGPLRPEQMKEQYLSCNVFVMPSSIENSPNSLGEAMLLGVPCVASCVGGVQDMMTDKKDGFIYPFDEEYMLAHYICEIFDDDSLAQSLGDSAQQTARKRFCEDDIVQATLNIYKRISG